MAHAVSLKKWMFGPVLVLLAIAHLPADGASLRKQCARQCKDKARACLNTERGALVAQGHSPREVRRAIPHLRRQCRGQTIGACRLTGLQACSGSSAGEGTIGPAGGTVTLAGVAEVIFPPGAFPAPQTVRIAQGTDPATDALFTETAAIFEPANRASYDVSILTGDVSPTGTVRVRLVVPPEVGAASLASAFGDFLTASDLDTLEQFELIEALERDSTSLTVSVAGGRFARLRRPDGQRELRLTLAGTALPAFVPGGRSQRSDILGLTTSCGGQLLGPPLATLAVRSPFDLDRQATVEGVLYIGHFGTDFVAADGTPLLAAGDGTVIKSEVSTSFGETVVLSLPGSGAVRYAHMRAGSRTVKVGDPVCRGQTIGESDNTGLSKGAHLHFEYAPNGNFGSNVAKIDPLPCIDPRSPDTCLSRVQITAAACPAGPACDCGFGFVTPGRTYTYAVSGTASGPVGTRLTLNGYITQLDCGGWTSEPVPFDVQQCVRTSADQPTAIGWFGTGPQICAGGPPCCQCGNNGVFSPISAIARDDNGAGEESDRDLICGAPPG